MRMHRGSSKDVRGRPPATGTLPLSASRVSVRIEITRGGAVERRTVRVEPGTLVRNAVRSVGQAPEGSAVLLDETPIPLDTPIDRPLRLVVVPTFSGG